MTLRLGAIVACALWGLAASARAGEPPAPNETERALPTVANEFKGDFDAMVERRIVRVLVPPGRTLYFNDKGRERGITADIVRIFDHYINDKYRNQLHNRPITVIIVPTTRDRLLPGVANGLGDIAAGDLTPTDEGRKLVDFFVAPDLMSMSEVVVTGPGSPAVNTPEELSGRTVHVRKSSSYYESLQVLNERFKSEGRAAITLVLVPEPLEDEDMLEMLNAGLLQTIIVDDWLAKMWAQVLPKITVNAGAVVRSSARASWAIRKDSPELRKILDEAYIHAVQKVNPVSAQVAHYSRHIKQLNNPAASNDYKRFEETLALFKKYGHQYGFDPLMLAAQGYQESQLNQQAVSAVGAIGLMQVMPATGAELKVGDITLAEPNVHAGAKYMNRLISRYFADAHFSEVDRCLFAFASYNAGPGNISKMREAAIKRGLDGNRWFNNVELVTAARIGIETTTYVRNIYKYYVSYRLLLDDAEAKRKAREAMRPGG